MARDAAPAAEILRFGAFALDAANALLTRGAERIELTPKAFAVLCHLAQRPGQLVTKDDLLDAVWGHRFVSESVLKTAVNTIRSALDDDAREPRFVETVPRRGYRFVAAASAASVAAPAAVTAPMPLPPPASAADEDGGAWIAREPALARLLDWAAQARGGARVLGLVGGEAGIGKSMLIDRFCAAVRGNGVTLAGGQCIEQLGGGEPFLPVLDALAGLARGPAAEAWTAALRERAPAWLARLPWLAGSGGEAPPPSEPERMLREFGALLDAATAAQPLVLVLEDLHWSDHATVQLLGYLARRRGTARWLVVGSFRPTDAALADHPLQALRQELRAQRRAEELLLDAFAEADVDAYLARRFAPGPVARRAELARTLHAHTEGLPIFISHVVDDWVATGALAQDRPGDGAWSLAPEAWGRLEVPETVAGLVERQIARLPGEWRALLEAAAVLGHEFAHDVLARVAGEPEEALRARCDALARRGEWLASAGMAERADGAIAFRYAFRHVLYQRVFLGRAEPAQQLQQHLAAARALQQLAPHAAELAQHLEAAQRIASASGLRAAAIATEARHWRLAAAREARALHALPDALAHYAQVLAFEPPPAERARVLEERSELLRLTGRGDLALAEAQAALAIAAELGDVELGHDIRLALARLNVRCDRVPAGLALADALLAEPALGDARRLQAWLVKAEGQRSVGDHAPADAALQAALQLVPADDDATRAAVLAERVAACFHRGLAAEGLALAREAQHLFERAGKAAEAARMLIRVGVFAQALAQPALSEASLVEARERLARLGDVDGQRGAILNLVKLHTDAGDAARALPLLEQGWALAEGFESPVAENAFLHGFYYCRLLRGELGAALADATRVLAGAEALHSLYWRVGAVALVSDLFIHLGDLGFVVPLLDGALEAMGPAGEQALRPRVVARRAWADLAAGEPRQALARIAALRASGAEEPQEDAAQIDRVLGQARLALGDAAGALAAIAHLDAAPTREVWAQVLALRLDAQRQLGAIDAATLESALAEAAAAHLPAVEGLVLRRSLVAALLASGRAAHAGAEGAHYEAERERLADSLAALPERRIAFDRAFPRLRQAGSA